MSGPIASTHIFQFNAYSDAGRSLFAHRRRLATTPGLRFSRLVFTGSTSSEGFQIGIVEPRRQLAMCVWENERALDKFLEHSPIGRSWQADTNQYCELRMKPFRAHGSYRGHEPFAGMQPLDPPGGPVAIWTFANIRPRGLRYFWDEIRGATDRLVASPGLIAGTAGPEHLYRGAMTFTIWEDLADTVRFAYRSAPHKGIVRDVKKQNLLTESMFIRFSPYVATGRWPAYSGFARQFEAFADSLHAAGVAPAGASS
jgi:hypothetical protein